jgi:hypothetical protein
MKSRPRRIVRLFQIFALAGVITAATPTILSAPYPATFGLSATAESWTPSLLLIGIGLLVGLTPVLLLAGGRHRPARESHTSVPLLADRGWSVPAIARESHLSQDAVRQILQRAEERPQGRKFRSHLQTALEFPAANRENAFRSKGIRA